MKNTKKKDEIQIPIERHEPKTEYITFNQLVKELTGIPFDKFYKDYSTHGDKVND